LLLNSVRVFRELLPKDAGKLDIVENDHVGIVFFEVVVLPGFVPPAETDDGGPEICEQILQRMLGPASRIDVWIVQIASEFGDNDRFPGRELR